MSTPQPNPDSAIRRLTVAVWILIALVIINICISLLGALFPLATAKRLAVSTPETFSSSLAPLEEYNNFSDWPLKKQIENATVIAVIRYEKDGDRFKAIISEILKQDPNVDFHYKVGDEYSLAGFVPREGTTYGDGSIIFFTGTHALMRYGCDLFGDRIAAFGDMSLDVLKQLVNKK